ncbi:hypothetical protein K502DRAFT_353899 [Neoconidiobolus thromboides FSU 785]|nr:hypothetical protein K502DRAFT_353899 [Neoconidiobolus thromboides FSU 785]
MLSIGLVALLACLRYFKIVLGWNGEAKMFAWVTVGYVLFCGVLSALALVFTEWKPLGAAVWCQPWNLDNKFDLIYLIVTTVMYGLQVIALTIFYVFITLRFVQKLNQYQFTMESNNIDGQSGISASTTPTSIGHIDHMHNYNIKKRNNRQSTSILIKMTCLIFFYLCTILPYVIVTLSEIIQFRERDRVADAILAITINCINLVNPLFLVLLHEPTKRDFYYLMGVWYNWIFSSNKKLAFTVVQ